MSRITWLFAVGCAALGSVLACSGPDVSVVENGGGAGRASGGTETTSGGTTNGVAGKGGASASGGTQASGGRSGFGGDAGGTDATGGMIGAAGEISAGGDGSGVGGNSGGCKGQAPSCFGNDVQKCCGNDPAGVATCQNGQWTCFGAPAPGCSGTLCIDEFSCGDQLKCVRSKTYCKITPVNAGSANYSCVPIPDSCKANGGPLCGCLQSDVCKQCSEEFGAVTLSCTQ